MPGNPPTPSLIRASPMQWRKLPACVGGSLLPRATILDARTSRIDCNLYVKDGILCNEQNVGKI